jgi:hypothetical protein
LTSPLHIRILMGTQLPYLILRRSGNARHLLHRRARRIRYIFLREYIPIPSLAAQKLQCDTELATRSLVHAVVHPHAPRMRLPPPVAPAPLSLRGYADLTRIPPFTFPVPQPVRP